MRLFRKLIRDKMPEILAQEGRQIKTRVLENDAEYFEWLRRKLLEETQEMAEKPDDEMFLVERFAYLDEIFALMAEVKKIEKNEIKKAQKHIIAERGNFRKRLLLE
ncbi:MAG: hypothetical protein AABX31_03635 [Nanoarchaeota archaeon]